MRLPIKLNDSFWPRFLHRWIGENLRTDPRIILGHSEGRKGINQVRLAKAVGAFRFGTTFKTTGDQRHLKADQLLLEHGVSNSDIILDIGASDGITSLNLMSQLEDRFKSYYVTDYNLKAWAVRKGKKVFFFDDSKECILIVTPYFVMYPGASSRVASWYQSGIQWAKKQEAKEILLIQPELAQKAEQNQHIHIQTHNVFKPWPGAKPSIIKVANVLNYNYFDEASIRSAIQILKDTLEPGGRLLIVENRPHTQAGLFKKTESGFEWISGIDQTDIHQLILEA